MTIAGQPRRRVTLFAVLMVVTCIACYLAGHLNGYRLRRAENAAKNQLFVRVYAVPITSTVAGDQSALSEVLEDVAGQIREGVMPSAWTRKELPCSIVPNAATQGVVVNADAEVHSAIASILSLVRDDRLRK